ncbi:ATPase P [Sediminicola sp. YIK13]|uniref:cation-translocating P-type ATPase n=1 Tax=Sediminicola sp. YIK13 TaxID=1453352 RepID=UPI000722DC32|nr:cation-transporting P-type ATPase [Sediminicola sp. YIK13]ALM07772.1 ATPase P [Sediminicola sp. YIK13]
MILHPYRLPINELVKQLGTNLDKGLNSEEVKERLSKYRANKIPRDQIKKRRYIFLSQFVDPIIYILFVATLLALLYKNWAEAIAIFTVIFITVFIGYFMELQAVRSLESLRKMGETFVYVLRSGGALKIKATEVVPGDILLLQEGDLIVADGRLIEQDNLQVKESSLTGESISIEKNTDTIFDQVPITEQSNMVFKGTMVTGGSGRAIVTSTGINTQLGKIHQLAMASKQERTPLEKNLNQLSKRLIVLTLFLTVLIIFTGYLRGLDFMLMLQTGIALAVATIPEGLPIVATIALARGMIRLSRKQVVIKSLEAVEALGATNIICTDKTGTLTEEKLQVHSIQIDTERVWEVHDKKTNELEALVHNKSFHEMMMGSVLCNDVPIHNLYGKVDTVDKALLDFASKHGYDPKETRRSYPELDQIPFTTDRKMMATLHQGPQCFHTYAKGAFESIIDLCDTGIKNGKKIVFENRETWEKLVDDMASSGLRTIAFAYKDCQIPPKEGNMLDHLTFLGILGFLDPARSDVKDTVAIYKKAGIRVVMITGDHLGTAKKIAQDIGIINENDTHKRALMAGQLGALGNLDTKQRAQILDANVFARVVPEQKLDLIKFYQENGFIVGMIGDGINDVPALKKADIGIAMGIRGTEAAREAADMILKNDKFTAIEVAIRQGRVIYQNIRQFVVYLISSNLAEVLSVGLAALLVLPSPLLPLQILFLNLITDIFPALALGLGKGEKGIMLMPPRKSNEPLMTPLHWHATMLYGLAISVGVLGITWYGHFVLKLSPQVINNMAFYTLILSQLLNIFNIPKVGFSFFRNEVTTNLWVWGAMALSLLLTYSAAVTAPIATALSLVELSFFQYQLVAVFAFGSLMLAQLMKYSYLIFTRNKL